MRQDGKTGNQDDDARRQQRLEELRAQVRVKAFDPLARVRVDPLTPTVLPDDALAVTGMEQLETQADAERLQENRDHAELIATAVAAARRTGQFHGRAWEQLSETLWVYAWKTLQSKIRSGEIAELVGKYTAWSSLHHGDAETLRVSSQARMELANEVIMRALPDFQRNALMAGRWDPEGAARLTTYFMGTCAFHFRRAYEHWAFKRRGKLQDSVISYGVDLVWVERQLSSALSDFAGDHPRLNAALELLEKQDEKTQMIFLLTMHDLTDTEIGEKLGLSRAAVESRARRFRERVNLQTVAA